MGHPHRVGHRGLAALGGGQIRVAVKVHQTHLAEPGQHPERDRAVAAQDQGQPPAGPDRGHFGRDGLRHGDDAFGVTEPVGRRHRAERRRGQIAAVLDVQPGPAQPVGQSRGPPGGRSLVLAGIMRTRAGRYPEDAHSPAWPCHRIRLQIIGNALDLTNTLLPSA